ncbi:MAG: methyltransferase domain-containing protein [Bacteroidota bacterium]
MEKITHKRMQYLRENIPDWHFPMLNDKQRNKVYDEAIGKVVNGKIIMDLGTGSGLLAMMAARGGARKVYAIEQNARLCQVAKAIIHKNGFEDVIHIIQKPVDDLTQDDIPLSVDVIITEIFDAGLLGEGCLKSIQKAKKFLTPKGLVLPKKAKIMGVLRTSNELRAKHLLPQHILGFDINPFLELRIHGALEKLNKEVSYDNLSEPTIIKTFDFNSLFSKEFACKVDFKIKNNGKIDCLGVWFTLYLDEVLTLENHPGSSLHWDQWLLFPPESIPAQKGDLVTIAFNNYGGRLIAEEWKINGKRRTFF